MQRTLRHNELTRRIVTRHIIGVYVVRSFVIVHRLQLEPGVIVWQNVGETVLRPVAWQVGKGAGLIATDVLQLFKFFTKSEN